MIISLLIMGCKKDVTDSTDIRTLDWTLKAVTTNVARYKPKNVDYSRENAYNLIFETDSTFSLNTSVNYAGGNFTIPKNGEVSIYFYEEATDRYF
jgi:hypothetical protein